jgi:ABC-2 type transport system permease protein
MGTEVGNSAALAVAWCAAISLGAFLWARAAYNHRAAR